MTSPATIREARRTDLERIARVYAQTTAAAPYYNDAVDEDAEFRRLSPRIAGYFDRSYHPSCARADRTLIVAESDEVVGFAAGHVSTRLGCTAELQWMFVLPELQRQGVGTALLKSLAVWFERVQCTRVIVDAPPDNPCRAFYNKHGAVPLDAHWLYWPDIRDCLRPMDRQ